MNLKMNRITTKLFIPYCLISLTLILGGCDADSLGKSSHKTLNKIDPISSPTPTPVIDNNIETLKVPGYDKVFVAVLEPTCAHCHSEGDPDIDVTNYNQVKALSRKVYSTTIVFRTMPKRKTLTQEQYDMLKLWLDNGAPEKDVMATTPKPNPTITPTPSLIVSPGPTPDVIAVLPTPDVVVAPPTPTPTPPVTEVITFDDIKVNILDKTCNECHAKGSLAKKWPLTKDEMINSSKKIVVPFKPDSSKLYTSVKSGNMPPKNDGYSMLSAAEILKIRTWILNGAKD